MLLIHVAQKSSLLHPIEQNQGEEDAKLPAALKGFNFGMGQVEGGAAHAHLQIKKHARIAITLAARERKNLDLMVSVQHMWTRVTKHTSLTTRRQERLIIKRKLRGSKAISQSDLLIRADGIRVIDVVASRPKPDGLAQEQSVRKQHDKIVKPLSQINNLNQLLIT